MSVIHGYRCWTCGKKNVVGRQISHSGHRTARLFKVNLHWKKLTLDGKVVRMRLCTKCLKRIKKDAREKTPKVLEMSQARQTAAQV